MRRIGIIGAGNMGMLHARLVGERKDAKVAAITDMDAERGQAAAMALGCDFKPDVDSLLDSGIDMVFIAVPNTAHGELTLRGLRAGLDVFVEKPLATGMADADRIGEARAKTGRTVFVGYNRRFAPIYAAAKEIVSRPNFKPANVNIIQNDGDMQNPPWLTDVSLTGGFMYDTTVHFLDMARFLFGEIVELRALGKNFFYPIADSFVVQLVFAGGAFGAITTCGHASWISPFERVQAVGDHQTVITEDLDRIRFSPALGAIVDGHEYDKLEYHDKWGYRQMHNHMFSCLENGGPALNGFDEGYRVVELIEACYRSAEQGGLIVPLPER